MDFSKFGDMGCMGGMGGMGMSDDAMGDDFADSDDEDQEVSKPDHDKLGEGAKAGHDAPKSEGDAPEEKKEATPSRVL
ncbi:hypothetical protein ACB092_07G039900 [Castanea dentata]